jgi:hypothetical protein
VELLLPACYLPSWRTQALCIAAAHGYWRILQLLLNYIDNMPADQSHLPAADLAAALCNAAGRGHLQCARLLIDRIVLDAYQFGHKPAGNRDLDNSLAFAAQAGDWQMVELITTAGWPDLEQVDSPSPSASHTSHFGDAPYAASVPGTEQRYAPYTTFALKAIVDPAAAAEAERYLRVQLYPVHRQTTLGGGSGSDSGRAASDGQQAHSTFSAGCHDDTGSSGSSNAVSDVGSSVTNSAASSGIPANVGANPDISEVEVEDGDEAETPSSQQHTPSRSRAAVLLIRAGANVGGKVKTLLKELAVSEGNEELRELLST